MSSSYKEKATSANCIICVELWVKKYILFYSILFLPYVRYVNNRKLQCSDHVQNS